MISSDGTVTQTRPDGTIITQIFGPDPRFGLQSPLLKELTIQLPSGLTATTNASQTVELSDRARETYVVGLEQIKEPSKLKAFNEMKCNIKLWARRCLTKECCNPVGVERE